MVRRFGPRATGGKPWIGPVSVAPAGASPTSCILPTEPEPSDEEFMAMLAVGGVELSPFQRDVARAFIAYRKPDWRRNYHMRRLARVWHSEARVLLRRGMDEVLDDATWAGLQAEAETLRQCADRLLEEVSERG
ncbi:hypothetical protein LGT39_12565 [Demequina sp. TTPB684]|uniref:hypothetical protein n=1 Tax=unclassified Demequina TaxID=2620311 RepID=UPI001CF0FE78|nr:MULTISPECIES: hypothetical protein [unclassified Demequina]MCB2413678.1 hypothetical protein [Demequina sp. TTPB684]UPU87740.1 hypothetical protein LGT36_010820 [Demequina sp. TMPB413]